MITMVEFIDYQCPHCRHMVQITDQLIVNNTDLRVVQRIIPAYGEKPAQLDSIVLASKQQGKYRKFSLEISRLAHTPNDKDIAYIASKLNLNLQELRKDAKQPSIIEQLQQNLLLFQKMGYRTIPQILIGRSKANAKVYRVKGEASYIQLQQLINHLKGAGHG